MVTQNYQCVQNHETRFTSKTSYTECVDCATVAPSRWVADSDSLHDCLQMQSHLNFSAFHGVASFAVCRGISHTSDIVRGACVTVEVIHMKCGEWLGKVVSLCLCML